MPINYGTKKMIYSKKRENTIIKHDIPDDSGVLMKTVWDTGKKQTTPLFVLCNSGDDMQHNHFEARKCYCADCREVFDLDVSGDFHSYASYKKESFITSVPSEFERAVKNTDPTCPSCGKTITDEQPAVFITANPATDELPDPERVRRDSSWDLPPVLQGRYVFAFRDDNGRITRVDDNMMLEQTVIFPSGKRFTHETEVSQTMDFVTGRIISYKTDITDNKRTPVGSAKEVTNPFLYTDPVNSFSMEQRVNVADARTAFARCGTTHADVRFQNFTDSVFGETFTKTSDFRISSRDGISFGGVSLKAMWFMSEEISDLKADIASEAIQELHVHPVYGDLSVNHLNLTEHKKDSDMTNTNVSREYQNVYMYMMTKYPAAAELAVQKAELRATNFEFAEKRKAAEDSSYTAKSATDKARAKFFREEMRYVAEQLSSCDDKILNEIRLASVPGPSYVYQDGKIQKTNDYHSPDADGETSNLQIMKDRLSFFVYGLREGYSVPGDIALKLKDSKTLTPATNVSKKLKNTFQADPIAVASNVYTLRKWGITNSDHVKQALDLISEQFPDVTPAPFRSKFAKFSGRHYTPFVNANVLAPLRDKSAMSFLKLYGKTHDTSVMISQILDNREDVTRSSKWQELVEDMRLYHDVMENGAVKIIRIKDDVAGSVAEQANDEQKKIQLRNYLDNSGKDGIKNAYRDFAGIYGANTVEMINMLAREIKIDRQMDEIKRFAEENGTDKAMKTYHEFLSRYDDPADVIDSHKLFSDRTLVISTRNNKPLFERDIKEIHDELSEINRKSVTENKYLTLSDQVMSMNETIPVDLSTLPASQWDTAPGTRMGEFSFHVLDNKFDFVRVATDLRNCVAGSSYFNSVERGRSVIVSMKNENNQTCACIELIPTHDDTEHQYYIKQLQGYRDSVVDARYSDVLTNWAQAHAIDLDRDPDGNVRACLNGEKRYFYGGGNADYHTDEYDPVLNTSVSVRKAESLRSERIAKAVELYGGDLEHGPALPDVPDDLK